MGATTNYYCSLHSKLQLLVASLTLFTTPLRVSSFALSDKSLSTLLSENANKIEELKSITSSIVPDVSVAPYDNDVFYLRYAMLKDDGEDTPESLLKKNLSWRCGSEGKGICEAARTSVATAAGGDSWNNEPVSQAAPHSSSVSTYLTPAQALTTRTSKGDVLYCIRAGLINDKELMSSVSVDQLVEFFVYCKEVHSLVANTMSIDQGRLVSVIFANDLKGVKLVGGDASFRTALSSASKLTSPLYPTLSGPTLLLNLPPLLGALVKLFSGLFPPAVKDRIRFEQGPLSKIDNLMDISYGGSERGKFLKELDEVLYMD